MIKILIIDDDPVSLKICSHYLEPKYHTLVADEVQKAKSILLFEQIHLVICDFFMKASSIEDLIDWRNSVSLSVPIIGMSKYRTQSEMKSVVAKGLFDFIPKPIDKARLHQSVELALASTVNQYETSAEINLASALSEANLPVLNFAALANTFGSNGEKIQMVIRAFIDELQIEAGKLNDLLLSGVSTTSNKNLVGIAHKLQSSASYVGADELAQTCRDLQAGINRGEVIQHADIQLLLSRLNKLEKRLRLVLEKNIFPTEL